MKGIVYILRSNTGRYYIGSTDNLDRRLLQHHRGHTQTTRNMNEFSLVFKEEFDSLSLARKVEQKLKKLKRKDYVEKIILDGFIKLKT